MVCSTADKLFNWTTASTLEESQLLTADCTASNSTASGNYRLQTAVHCSTLSAMLFVMTDSKYSIHTC